MYGQGLVALLFFVLVLMNIFLMFQVHDHHTRGRDLRTKDQETVQLAARLLVQSATQEHPLLAHEHAVEAKMLIKQVVDAHGGVLQTERDLKLPKGRLENLRAQVLDRHRDMQDILMSRIVEQAPELDFEANVDAGLRYPARSDALRSDASRLSGLEA